MLKKTMFAGALLMSVIIFNGSVGSANDGDNKLSKPGIIKNKRMICSYNKKPSITAKRLTTHTTIMISIIKRVLKFRKPEIRQMLSSCLC